MIDERHAELAALHALDLLEGAEKTGFEALIANNSELRALVADLHESGASLALAVRQVEPPAGLKARVLAAADASPQLPRADTSASTAEDKVIPFPTSRFIPWGVAALFAVAAILFGFRSAMLHSENEALRTERELAVVAYKMAQNQLSERTIVAEKMIADLGAQLKHTEDLSRLKITALASLLGNTPEAKAIAVWDPTQQSGLLTVEKLPAIAAEQDYQIWVVDPQYSIPVDGGVFKPDSTGKAVLTFKADKPIKQAAAFAISLERKGGVPKAEGPMVLLGKQ